MRGFPQDRDIQVTARLTPFNSGVEVIVYKRIAGGHVSILTVDRAATAARGTLTYCWSEPRGAFEVLRDEDVFMRIQDFAPQLAAALSEIGIPLPDRSFTEGKLTAIEEHLKDMRALVFEKKPETFMVDK